MIFSGKEALVSIVIPFQTPSNYLRQTLDALEKIERSTFEVVLLPDASFRSDMVENCPYPIIVIPTGPVSPAIKRDRGVEVSSGTYIAFIDDDAYPDPNWLTNALPYFNDLDCVAVGGPQVTPMEDSFWQHVSGAVFLSPLNGHTVCRYKPCPGVERVDDWPSVNFIVRKDAFLACGGFDSEYWPGEDSKLCHSLLKDTGKHISYAHDAIVYHHRRSGFFRHIKQVGNYGFHRGHFARKYPENSRKPIYFVPSLFFLFVLTGWTLPFLLSGVGTWGYQSLWLLYAGAIGFSSISIIQSTGSLSLGLATIPYIVGTHFWYGLKFLRGFFARDIKSILGR